MRLSQLVTSSSSLQVPPLPSRVGAGPVRGTERPPEPPRSCGSAGRTCWSPDLKVALLLVTLAGAVILLLLYRLLQLRHRLRLARARHTLEYNSFYHSATYRLQQPTACQEIPTKNGSLPAEPAPIQTITTITSIVAPPSLPLPPTPPAAPPPGLRPPSLPLILTTPPSPHLSWGACSDGDVYSRIGAFRPSRPSSLSSRSTVILFEHSAL
ncbi:actin cytoskeleton-regulatory complex protein pan1-like [Xiphophorus couchianus]|uniref:actin cytoskeleton-regulatory complex protein pan1-like n=1 Tax=Xiphophorus couchianus TaxID=32473 RepID=UPI00101683B7|nr:actin cytoskeleton-regulatory complex protein pan1-like [Xiphophorus couchianus]XP_027881723.1 actin cytoskeleton-regulatory complex protein pan1-like [Xiphophorus couchianus]